MKRITILSTICFLILTMQACLTDKGNYLLTITNNSNDSIIMAYKFYYDTLCVLQGSTIKSGNAYTEHSGEQCWEKRLSNGRTYEFYIIDPKKFNPSNKYYNCDSIEEKNDILKHYVLTLDDLKNINWEITYP